MGKSHFTSDIIGKGSITVASLASVTASTITAGTSMTAPSLVGSTSASAPTVNASTKVKAGSYFQMGTHQYIFFGRGPSSGAALVALGTNLSNDASVKGSLFINYNATKGNAWYFVSDTSASPLSAVA